ncbi:MAG: hypothetical protein VX354_00690 [Pseudomonadota bacterium]
MIQTKVLSLQEKNRRFEVLEKFSIFDLCPYQDIAYWEKLSQKGEILLLQNMIDSTMKNFFELLADLQLIKRVPPPATVTASYRTEGLRLHIEPISRWQHEEETEMNAHKAAVLRFFEVEPGAIVDRYEHEICNIFSAWQSFDKNYYEKNYAEACMHAFMFANQTNMVKTWLRDVYLNSLVDSEVYNSYSINEIEIKKQETYEEIRSFLSPYALGKIPDNFSPFNFDPDPPKQQIVDWLYKSLWHNETISKQKEHENKNNEDGQRVSWWQFPLKMRTLYNWFYDYPRDFLRNI